MTLAMAENANVNGIEFFFDTKVLNIVKDDGEYVIETNKGNIELSV